MSERLAPPDAALDAASRPPPLTSRRSFLSIASSRPMAKRRCAAIHGAAQTVRLYPSPSTNSAASTARSCIVKIRSPVTFRVMRRLTIKTVTVAHGILACFRSVLLAMQNSKFR